MITSDDLEAFGYYDMIEAHEKQKETNYEFLCRVGDVDFYRDVNTNVVHSFEKVTK